VYGFASTTTGANYGVYGHSNSTAGHGVLGNAPYIGILGNAYATSGTNWGVHGSTASTIGYGVAGYALPSNALGAGIYGSSTSSLGYGVFSSGNFAATGTKSFQIDHPTDPGNKYLNHYCTEGPQPLNVYGGNATLDANGSATIGLPSYFEEINKEFRYQLTPIGAGAPNLHVAQKIQNNSFRIAGGQAGLEVSWRVEAVRNDLWVRQHGAPVEVEKAGERQGKYLHPELYGAPKEQGIHYVEHSQFEVPPQPELPESPTKEDKQP
jgi:hypothetical protein